MVIQRNNRLEPTVFRKRSSTSDYTRDTERKVERLLSELYDALQIQRPDDLYGSIVIETKYQKGQPVGQVDIQVRYVMKRMGNSGQESPRVGSDLKASDTK
ncbi:MAG: hypothetical protein ABIR47_02870 [Candidatus Kapaibacterium sp.]